MPLEKRQSTPLLYVTFHEVAAYRASNDVVGALTRSRAIVDSLGICVNAALAMLPSFLDMTPSG
jgi:hypothetical protein